MYKFNTKYCYKSAFTLAETLVTIGIIGIVAAMTIPSLIQKYRNYVLHKQFLKSYSNLSQAIMLMKADLGIENLRREYATYYGSENGGYKNEKTFYNEFDKYMKVVQKVPQYSIKNYNATGEAGKYTVGNDNPKPLFICADGSSIGRYINNSQIYLYMDVNGPNKGPNRYGFDVFMFYIHNKNDVVYPMKQERAWTEEELENVSFPEIKGYPCSIKSKQKLNGMGCSWFAVNNINPDNENKTYWDNLPW